MRARCPVLGRAEPGDAARVAGGDEVVEPRVRERELVVEVRRRRAAAEARRGGDAAGFWRRPNDNRTVRAIYPNGFLPFIASTIYDGSAVAGLRGEMGGWNWDLSAGFGRNSFRFDVKNSANVSLGAASPTEFYAGTLVAGQFTGSLGVVKGVVPLPHALDNDQLQNATRLAESGGAWCIEQKDLTPERLASAIARLLTSPGTLGEAAAAAKSQGRPDAVASLADLVEAAAYR